MGQLIVIIAMFALLWVFFIMPQRRRAQAQRELLTSVEIGDEIVTAGGIYGHVRAIDADDVLHVDIAPGTQIRVARRAVAAKIPIEHEPPALEATDEEPSGETRS